MKQFQIAFIVVCPPCRSPNHQIGNVLRGLGTWVCCFRVGTERSNPRDARREESRKISREMRVLSRQRWRGFIHFGNEKEKIDIGIVDSVVTLQLTLSLYV
ncbi:hypothetical protein AVEN_238844-1 [Araneus ventricosus]|uniref:Uncharacterized protein n=1 Tax=Araneus ventricosus TaxID=182803 RepID=A0A4Y2ENM2_ARAVE|nr:hypothetical protein AVEN_238844-1 [Araneus ventricosus]